MAKSSNTGDTTARKGTLDDEQVIGLGYDAADAVLRKLAGASASILRVRARARLRDAVRVTGGPSAADAREVDEHGFKHGPTPPTVDSDAVAAAKARGVAAQQRLVVARFGAMRAAVAPFAVADGASVVHGYVVSAGGVGQAGRIVRAIDDRDRAVAEHATDARGYFRLGLDGARKAGSTDGTIDRVEAGGLAVSQPLADAIAERAKGSAKAEEKAAVQAEPADQPAYALADAGAAWASPAATRAPALGAGIRLVVLDSGGKELWRDAHAFEIRLGHALYRELVPVG